LLFVSFLAPSSVITSRITSLSEPPICQPMLPPSIRIAAGAPQSLWSFRAANGKPAAVLDARHDHHTMSLFQQVRWYAFVVYLHYFF
jgi:hypothetical protein